MTRLFKLFILIPLVYSFIFAQTARSSTVGEADALVIDPPSNVRAIPNGRITCQVKQRKVIQVYHWSILTTGETSPTANGWYSTHACGEDNSGWIHESQIKLLEDWRSVGFRPAQIVNPPSNIREEPNGRIVCQVKRRDESLDVATFNPVGKWYRVSNNECSGYMHDSQFKIIYSYQK